MNETKIANKMTERDIFDKIIDLPLLRLFKPFYSKNKEMLLYLFFGGLAFLVSMGTFAFFEKILKFNELIANILSWIITVLFAFVTNRKWVFIKNNSSKPLSFWNQMSRFYAGRIATLVVEESILFVFVTRMSFNSIIVKTVAQIIVIVLNYVISKMWIFKGKNT